MMGFITDMFSSSKTGKKILYLVSKSKKIDRLKLMKLMFLLEYYNPKEKKLESRPNIENKFIIYNYGVFSFEVYKELLNLIDTKKLIESNKTLKTEEEVKLDDETKEKLDLILKEFDKLDGWELVDKTLELLKIRKDDKYKYTGVPVEVILAKA